MSAPSKLAHIVWKTGRMQAMVDWWCTVLEASPVFTSPFITFITYDEEHHRVAFLEAGCTETPSPAASGVEHVAFTYATLDDLLGTYRRLADAGITPYWCINHGPTTSMYYADPDGNHVELQIDNFDDADDLAEWFRSGAFAANPIGVDFDPDLLERRRDEGVPRSELTMQGSAPVQDGRP